jgi:hypothetical protein
MKILKRIWNYFYNDWQVIDAIQGIWNISVHDEFFGDYKETKYCRYEIQYSKLEETYRLKCFGYMAKEHKQYPNAVEVFKLYKNKEKEA